MIVLIWLLFSVFLGCIYAWLLKTYVQGFNELPTYKLPLSATPKTTVAVIVPARNEALNIEKCLQSIVEQQYPNNLLEIIVIDDYSTDETPELINQFIEKFSQVRSISLAKVLPTNTVTNAYKKKAIEAGIAQTKATLIVTTDADCVLPTTWLLNIVNAFEATGACMIAAPVCFTGEQTFFQRFQSLDFMGMMVATGASVYYKMASMCNGANLAYLRSAFLDVGGFSGIDGLASGDDMLLMHKISKQYSNNIIFLKNLDAIAYTAPQATVSAFIHQRWRWASKSKHYADFRITFYLASVFFFVVTLLVNLIAALIFGNIFWLIFVIQLLIKLFFDYKLLNCATSFFNRKDLMGIFLPSQIVHCAYIIGIGTLGNVKNYIWKGRKVQ